MAILAISLTGNAQVINPVPSSAARKLEKVQEAFDRQDWNEARDLADKLVRQHPGWPEGWKTYASVYQATGDLKSGELGLERLVALDSTGYPDAYRWMAEWAFNRGEYHRAWLKMNKYLQLTPDTGSSPFRIKLLDSSIRFALEQVSQPVRTGIRKLGGPVNTADDEYFPSLSVDGSILVFTRQFSDSTVPGKKRIQESLFYSTWGDSTYRQPEELPYPINTPGNEGTQSLRQDGRIMFFTACSRPDTKGGCDLYYCVKTGDAWSNPANLGYPVNTRYWESTPYLASDGKRLYFASNRPGGSGGMDIWLSTLNPDQGWSVPVNLGPPVNTPLDEMSPVLLVDGRTLFFASNGHAGMGGFDLFKFDLAGADKSFLPENLGFEVNTYADEDAITVNAATNTALLASNRDSAGGKDIYQLDMKPFITARTSLSLTGTVRDRLTGLPLGARMEVEPHGDPLVSRVESDPMTGIYLLGVPARPSYRVAASSPGYLPYSGFYVYDSLSESDNINFSFDLEPIRLGASIIMRNIFFAHDSYELLPESDPDLLEIVNLIRQNPGIVIEISGFTDNTGTSEYNNNLSLKRAESVRSKLVSLGVSPDQLTAAGYGSTRPVAPNYTEEGRGLNRRTEMKVIKY